MDERDDQRLARVTLLALSQEQAARRVRQELGIPPEVLASHVHELSPETESGDQDG